VTRAGVSMLAFAGYQATTGLTLLLAPQVAYLLLQLPATPFLWRGLFAMVLLILAYLCTRAALEGNERFIRWTLETRTAMAIFIAIAVTAGVAPWPLLLFTAADTAAVAWTIAALRADRRQVPAAPMPMQ
jgi:hypothetical protein